MELNKNIIINLICVIIILVLFLIRSLLAQVLNKILIIGVICLGLIFILFQIGLMLFKKDNIILTKVSKTINEYYQVILLVLVIVEVVFGFIFFPATVVGTSMFPTLLPDDKLLVVSTTNVTNDDIIVFRYDSNLQKANVGVQDDELLIKRIIGVPGQQLQYKSDGLYIDGIKQEDQFFVSEMVGIDVYFLASLNNLETECIKEDGTIVIPDKWYIVFGDNRKYYGSTPTSIDSRTFGLVHESQIYGKVWVKQKTIFNWESIND